MSATILSVIIVSAIILAIVSAIVVFIVTAGMERVRRMEETQLQRAATAWATEIHSVKDGDVETIATKKPTERLEAMDGTVSDYVTEAVRSYRSAKEEVAYRDLRFVYSQAAKAGDSMAQLELLVACILDGETDPWRAFMVEPIDMAPTYHAALAWVLADCGTGNAKTMRRYLKLIERVQAEKANMNDEADLSEMFAEYGLEVPSEDPLPARAI